MAHKRSFNGEMLGLNAHTPSMREREVPSAEFLARANRLFPDHVPKHAQRQNRAQYTV
jgi:hypothetical protein